MQTALECLEIVARINRVDIDLRTIIREYALTSEELSVPQLLRIASRLDFKAAVRKVPLASAGNYPFPMIVENKDNSYCVLLKIEGEQAMVYKPLEKKAAQVFVTELQSAINDGLIILKYKKMLTSQVKFGFGWFFHEVLKFKPVIMEVMLGSFMVQLFGLVTPLFTQVILDKVIVHHSMTTLDVLAVAFIAVVIFEFLLNISRKYIYIHTANKLDARLGAKLFRHLFSLPMVYFESRKVGNIISRVRELDNIREFLTNKSMTLIVDVIFSFVFVAVMLLYSVKLTLISLGFISVIGVLYFFITPVLRRRLDDKFAMSAQSNSYLVESVTGMQTVKSLAIEGAMQKKWEDYLGGYIMSSFKLSNLMNIAGGITGVLQRVMTIVVLYLGVKLVILNQLTVGQLIAFNMISAQLAGPVLRLVNLWNEFQQSLLAVDRLADILNHPIEVQSSKAITLPGLRGEVKFDNVSFRYNVASPNVLDKINLLVEPGTSVGIVGRSGSGKSTLTRLIQRLYVPAEGAVYVDDIDVRHFNPVWLRYNIGVVLQDDYLFSGTIRENISMPRPDAPMETIIQAAQVAGAHEFITAMPEGYDTMVGERGSTLSGGQKQRIAIARAIITNPRILIFDEATSALDYESERIVRQNMVQIRKGRTLFIIAHRLSTVRDCDRLIVLDKGCIVEQGTHAELLAKKGYYYELSIAQG